MAEKSIEARRLYVDPRGQVLESREGWIQIVLEMPGVRKEDLEIKIENNEMRILGRRPESADRKYVLRERRPGDFLRTYTLDGTIDQSRIDAALQDGILTVQLELKEQVKPRSVKIRSE